jgi:hypothetical protein
MRPLGCIIVVIDVVVGSAVISTACMSPIEHSQPHSVHVQTILEEA